MKSRISAWLRKEIKVPRPAPSPRFKLVGRAVKMLLLSALCVFVIWRAVLAWEVSSRLATIHKAGFPTSGAELNMCRVTVPEEENAALHLLEAFSLVRTLSDSRSNEVVEPKLLERTNGWSPSTRGMIEEYVTLNALPLDKVRKGLELPKSRFPVDFSFGPDTPLPHLAQLKTMARVVALQSSLSAEEGHGQASADCVEVILKLARTLDEEPIAISFLVRGAMIQIATKTTERNLNRSGLGEEAAGALQRAFAECVQSNLLSHAFIGERAMIIPAYRLSREEAEAASRDNDGVLAPRPLIKYAGKPNPFLWLTGFFERDLNFYLQTMESSISVAALPAPRSLGLTNQLELAAQRANRRRYVLSAMLLPAFTKIAIRDATFQAGIRLTITALAVERFRVNHGRLPGDLKELAPEFVGDVPRDPFNGEPLRYERLIKGYVIYSVGPDGHDDGGREPPERRTSKDKTSYDITFIVER